MSNPADWLIVVIPQLRQFGDNRHTLSLLINTYICGPKGIEGS